MPNHSVEFLDMHREPANPFRREFMHGMDVDLARDAREQCQVNLPWPSRRCGQLLVTCRICGYAAVLTVAGRVDDPRSVKLPCKPERKP